MKNEQVVKLINLYINIICFRDNIKFVEYDLYKSQDRKMLMKFVNFTKKIYKKVPHGLITFTC